MKIFISHSSKDQKIITAFVDKILKLGCGLSDSQIFCTSIQGLGIENGTDFRKHIKDNLKDATHVFIMISDNYKKSEVCINEMGAAWAREDCEIVQLLFPDLGFDKLGVLTNPLQAGKLNDSSELDLLHEKIGNDSGIKISRWNQYKKDFIDLFEGQGASPPLENTEETKFFFNQILQKNYNVKKLFLMMQPNLLDCKYAFQDEYYLDFYHHLNRQSEWIDKEGIKDRFERYSYVKVEKANNNFTGGMTKIYQEGYLNYDADFYLVTLLENKNDESGPSFKYFCFVNGRWVFMMKPWYIVEAIKNGEPYWQDIDRKL